MYILPLFQVARELVGAHIRLLCMAVHPKRLAEQLPRGAMRCDQSTNRTRQ